MKVFLGGTCNESNWRDRLIKKLKIDYFNPVVPDWTEECYQQELKERAECDYCLYVITPKMTGVYSIAEVIDDSNKRLEKTLFYFMANDDGHSFTDGQVKSLLRVAEMVERNGGHFFYAFQDIAEFLNGDKLTGIEGYADQSGLASAT